MISVCSLFIYPVKSCGSITVDKAVVGATGVLEFFLQVVNKFSNIGGKPFKTRAEAMDWLADP